MEIKEYLEHYQKIPYQIFLNAISNNSFFHAYLFTGPIGIPYIEIAKYLASSIVCEHKKNNFACLECSNCKKIVSLKNEESNFNRRDDVFLLDGSLGTIKIENIRMIESEFSKTSENKKIYIINLIENMSEDASNALLKFLEEPDENTFAFLITHNEHKILPTIKSRTQIIHFTPLNQKILLETFNNEIENIDKEILSFYYNDKKKIIEFSHDENYIEVKKSLLNFLENITNKKKYFILIEDVIEKFKTKITSKLFIDLFLIFLKETIKINHKNETYLQSCVNILKDLNKSIKNLDDAVLVLMDARNDIDRNINIQLSLYSALNKIFGETNE